uniref:Uncharacterized protein n=1 Tax=Cacopsylla melanoneura TaxID=428564 RepID=A0A8D8VAW7_9HEMI
MTLLLHVRAPFLHLPARWPERLLMPSYSHRPRDLPLPFLLPFPFRGTPLRVHHGSTQGTLTCGHLQFESNREPPTTSKSRDMKSPASSPLSPLRSSPSQFSSQYSTPMPSTVLLLPLTM